MVRSFRPDLKRATAEQPLMVIKHHLFTNFTVYGMEEPTWINVAREPVSRFVSSYYFRRFGFKRHEGARNKKIRDGRWSISMVMLKLLPETLLTQAASCWLFMFYLWLAENLSRVMVTWEIVNNTSWLKKNNSFKLMLFKLCIRFWLFIKGFILRRLRNTFVRGH